MAGVLLGDPMVQMTLSIFALLPWWTVHFRHSQHASLAVACIQARLQLPPFNVPALLFVTSLTLSDVSNTSRTDASRTAVTACVSICQ